MSNLIKIFVFVFLISACSLQSERVQFTEEDVRALNLENVESSQVDDGKLVNVDVNPFLDSTSFIIDDLISDVKAIKLETNRESLVGVIYKIIFTDENIYIYDNYKRSGVIIFKRDGSFVKRLEHGSGPGELYRVWDMDYDFENEELYVYQHPFFLVYNKNGDYRRDIKLPLGFYNFKVTPNGYLFKTIHCEGNFHLGKYNKCTLFATDKSFQLKNACMSYVLDMGYVDYQYLHPCGDKWYVTQPFADTVFSIGKDRILKAEYVLDYNKKHISSDALRYDRNRFAQYLREHDEFYNLGRLFETPNYSLFSLKNDQRGTLVVYRNKTTGKMKGGFTQLVRKDMPLIPFPVSTFGDYFVSLSEPSNFKHLDSCRFFSKEQLENLKNMSDDDNPVILLYRIDNL